MNYVLITPARNEENSIQKTIESVINQSVLPVKWVIVSDASEDGTDEIVRKYCDSYKFIHFLRKETRNETGFASKVCAFNAGLQCITEKNFDYIGNLDADIVLEPSYFEAVLKELESNPKLGIAGGRVYENIGHRIFERKSSITSVAGAIQLFRTACYEQVGGYIPLKNGGIDTAAEIIARSKGWEVKTLMNVPVFHTGPVLTGSGPVLKRKFFQGVTHYQLGYKPLFETVRQAYRISEKPFLTSSLARLSGYFWAYLKQKEILLPYDTVQFFHREQIDRLEKMKTFLHWRKYISPATIENGKI